MLSQVIGNSIVLSAPCLGLEQRKHENSTWLAVVSEIGLLWQMDSFQEEYFDVTM